MEHQYHHDDEEQMASLELVTLESSTMDQVGTITSTCSAGATTELGGNDQESLSLGNANRRLRIAARTQESKSLDIYTNLAPGTDHGAMGFFGGLPS